MHRQLGEVGVVAGQHHLLARRLGARHLDDLGLGSAAAAGFRRAGSPASRRTPRRAGRGRPSRCRPVPASPARRRGTAPPWGCPRARRQAGEIDRLAAGLEFACAGKLIDEAAQPEAVEIRPPATSRPSAVLSTTFIGVLPLRANYRGFRAPVQRRLAAVGKRAPALDSLRRTAQEARQGSRRNGSQTAEPTAARISAARCRASRTCGWCAAPAATPTTFRCRTRPIAVFVRSPHAHALIKRIDTAAARDDAGRDRGADRRRLHRRRPQGRAAAAQSGRRHRHQDSARSRRTSARCWTSGSIRWCTDRVRYPGEAVAMVVAETLLRRARRRRGGRGRIRGAASRRPTSARPTAREPIWPRRAADNVALDQDFGDAAAVQAAFAAADLVVEQTFRQPAHRQLPDGAALRRRLLRCRRRDSYTLISGNQGVHAPRMVLAESFGVPLEKIRFVCPDVGGGFGLRNNLYPEQTSILWAAKRVGRPVKWTNDRSESFLTDYAGPRSRDHRAARADQGRPHHRLSRRSHRHLRRADRDLCAAEQRLSRRHHGLRHPADAHALPLDDDQHGADRAVPRRRPARGDAGAGAADRSRRRRSSAWTASSIRQKNVIPSKKLPYRTASGLLYDSGDFAGNMKRMVEAADWKGFAARRRESKKRGKLRGIGISNYRRDAGRHPARARRGHGAGQPARSSLRSARNRPARATRRRFAQVMADLLGVHPEDIVFIGGDTAKVASGSGTHSDRSMRLGGTLMVEASSDVVAQAKAVGGEDARRAARPRSSSATGCSSRRTATGG